LLRYDGPLNVSAKPPPRDEKASPLFDGLSPRFGDPLSLQKNRRPQTENRRTLPASHSPGATDLGTLPEKEG
jgi:hypothetical protein